MERGEYLVIWHAMKRYRKRGLVNRIFGKKVEMLKPCINGYESEEIASYGFNTVRSLGAIEPKMVRVIRE